MVMDYSHTKLSDYLGCPLKFKLEYIDGRTVLKSEDLLLGSKVHELIEGYGRHLVETGQEMDPSYLETVSGSPEALELLEKHVKSHRYKLSGRILIEEKLVTEIQGRSWTAKLDRLRLDGDTAYIRDYKTDWKTRSQADIDSDPQLQRYALVVGKLFPEVKRFVCVLDFVRWNILGQTEFTRYDFPKIEAETVRIIEMIEKDEEFKPTPGPACDYCSWTGECPRLKSCDIEVITCEEDAIKLVEEKIVCEARKKAIDKLLKHYCTRHGSIIHNGMDTGYHKKSGSRYTNVEAIVSALEREDIDPYKEDVIRINKDALAVAVAGKDDLARYTEAFLADSSSTEFKAKKVKKGAK